MAVYVVTGVTSGLGLEAVRALMANNEDASVIVGARAPDKAVNLREIASTDRLWISPLDTSSIASVHAFAGAVLERLGDAPIAGLALNAGVQFVNDTPPSVDGHDLTFATNVLGHIALTRALSPALTKNSVVVSTASGTHDVRNKLAQRSGFRGGFFPSADAVARGNVSDADSERQRGLDRYATSKLCNVLFTYVMARRNADGPRYIAFDPGMMPGTELARDRSETEQFAWKTVLPKTVALMKGASTPKRSGKLLADLLQNGAFPEGTGLHVEFTGEEIPSSVLSYDEKAQDDLLTFAEAAIRSGSGSPAI